MRIYKLAGVNAKELSGWIANLVNTTFGGSERANEGWCGEVSGEIYRYLKSKGELPEIWSVVSWNDEQHNPIIENPTLEERQDVLDEVTGTFTHSFVKWNDSYWDGIGENSLQNILNQHAFGELGNGVSIMREYP